MTKVLARVANANQSMGIQIDVSVLPRWFKGGTMIKGIEVRHGRIAIEIVPDQDSRIKGGLVTDNKTYHQTNYRTCHFGGIALLPKFGLTSAEVLAANDERLVLLVAEQLVTLRPHNRISRKGEPAAAQPPTRICQKELRAAIGVVNAFKDKHSDLTLRINEKGRLEAVAAVVIG